MRSLRKPRDPRLLRTVAELVANDLKTRRAADTLPKPDDARSIRYRLYVAQEQDGYLTVRDCSAWPGA